MTPRRLVLAAALAACLAAPHRAGGGDAPPGPGAAPSPARVAARATWRDRPLPGVRVGWYRSLPPEGKAAAEGVTDAEGRAAALLPPGRYFLVAAWRPSPAAGAAAGEPPRPAPGDRFGYYGGNPVSVRGGEVPEAVLPLVEVPPPPPPFPGEAPPGSGVRGTVTLDGAPLRDAVVSAYGSADGAFRELPHAVAPPTGEDGAFALELPPGPWFLVARKRAGGASAGPLRPGDAFAFLPANPLRVEPGRWSSAALPATVRKRGASAGPALPEAASVSGRITGKDGRPRRGMYAGLYDREERFGRPRFLSEPTGADGRYRISVPAGGTFFLGARSGYGGSPAPGDLQGRRDGPDGGAFTLREGDRLEGIDIVADEVW